MTINDLIELYEAKKRGYGDDAYRHISELLREAKEKHRKDFLQSNTARRASEQGRIPDHEQSWRAFKGKNLEKLIVHIIQTEIESLGLKIVRGETLERTKGENLSKELSQVKRNLSIDYGEFGLHLPDVDIIAYHPKSYKVIAIISSKVTLRERIAQTGYWKFKLLSDEVTEHIQVYFITPDEDNTLTYKHPAKKGRAIVETDIDGSYVMSETQIEESDKVKMFDKFIEDIKKLIDFNEF